MKNGKVSVWWYIGVFIALNVVRQFVFPPSEHSSGATIAAFFVVLAITIGVVKGAAIVTSNNNPTDSDQ